MSCRVLSAPQAKFFEVIMSWNVIFLWKSINLYLNFKNNTPSVRLILICPLPKTLYMHDPIIITIFNNDRHPRGVGLEISVGILPLVKFFTDVVDPQKYIFLNSSRAVLFKNIYFYGYWMTIEKVIAVWKDTANCFRANRIKENWYIIVKSC